MCGQNNIEATEESEPKQVILGGNTIGISMYFEGVLVVGFSDIVSNGKNISPAKASGIKKGDIIYLVNGKKISKSDEFSKLVEQSEGKNLNLGIKRENKILTKKVTPVFYDDAYKYKIGAWVRDSIAGIGTITYIEPETLKFAALGHKVEDTETGIMPSGNSGDIRFCENMYVIRGKEGSPGGLQGDFLNVKSGIINKNSKSGLFGTLLKKSEGETVFTSTSDEVKEGNAFIYADVLGEGVQKYTVLIEKILNKNYEENKNMIIKVTDPKLLSITGGIVQGMSGSPLVQNGKLIGAVTHVFVNDPTRGYGIFIENMLTEAEKNK